MAIKAVTCFKSAILALNNNGINNLVTQSSPDFEESLLCTQFNPLSVYDAPTLSTLYKAREVKSPVRDAF